MRLKIVCLAIAIITVAISLAETTAPDSMYVHLTGSDNTDSIVVFAIAKVDSIVYYAPTASSSPEDDFSDNSGTFTDNRDSETYNWVKIGEQIWMAQNLRTNITRVDTTGGVTDAVCQTEDVFTWDNTDNIAYGKLYSWQAALKSCPTGWHLPSDNEWKTLERHMGMSESDINNDGSNRGTNEGTKLKSTSGWNPLYEEDANGTDDYSFNALPAGAYYYGALHSQGSHTFWYTRTPNKDSSPYTRTTYDKTIIRQTADGKFGFSVRCVKNDGNEKYSTPSINTIPAHIIAQKVSLGGEITNNGFSNITSCGIEYSLSTNFSLGSGIQIESYIIDSGTFSVKAKDLTSETTYYYRAFATNQEGTTYGSEMSFTTNESVPDLAVGDFAQGGVVFYILQNDDLGYEEDVQHGLICTLNEPSGGVWYNYDIRITGATDSTIGTGTINTQRIINTQGVGNYAALQCANYEITIDGINYDDWFLPSKDELNALYNQKGIINSTAVNNDGNPLENEMYWSSTQSVVSGWAIYQSFNDGEPGIFMTYNGLHVRAIREF